MAGRDGADDALVRHEGVPGLAASSHDVVVAVEQAVSQLRAAQIGPYILDGVQFGRIGRQLDQADVVGDDQLVADMPAGPVQDESRMGPGRHGLADFDQVQVHGLGVGARHHQPRADGPRRPPGRRGSKWRKRVKRGKRRTFRDDVFLLFLSCFFKKFRDSKGYRDSE